MSYYVGLLHKGRGTAYGVSFPDFPGCIGADDESAEGAVRNAIEALAFHVEGLRSDGERIQKPRALEEWTRDRAFRKLAKDAAIVYVPLLAAGGKLERVNISLDANTLDAIDAAARRRGMNRSEFLAAAARRAILQEAG